MFLILIGEGPNYIEAFYREYLGILPTTMELFIKKIRGSIRRLTVILFDCFSFNYMLLMGRYLSW